MFLTSIYLHFCLFTHTHTHFPGHISKILGLQFIIEKKNIVYTSLLSIIFFFLSYSSRQHIFVFDYFDMLSIFYCDEFQFSTLMFCAVVSNYIYVSRRILQMNKLNCRPDNEHEIHNTHCANPQIA